MKRFLPLLAVPAFLLAACSAGNGTTASPAPGATTATASAPSDTTTTTSTPAAGSTTTSGSSSGQGAASSTRCHTADLSLKFSAGDGAAGTYHQNLIFTNKSGHKCTLYGYPGVSWVTGTNGTQVNDPFQRNSGTKKTITLASGGHAHAVVITHAAGNYPADKCKPVSSRGYRIYPPDETASIFVSQPGTECSAKGVNLGQVLPIESGVGTQGE
jgi:hypothetical protein